MGSPHGAPSPVPTPVVPVPEPVPVPAPVVPVPEPVSAPAPVVAEPEVPEVEEEDVPVARSDALKK
jgi:hypothetical protein